MGQPQIYDETGIMKFRYVARMSAETHVTIHLLPDHVTPGFHMFWKQQQIALPRIYLLLDHVTPGFPMFWKRQQIALPHIYSPKEDITEFWVPCLPYDIPHTKEY
jgi:hypothetical protein